MFNKLYLGDGNGGFSDSGRNIGSGDNNGLNVGLVRVMKLGDGAPRLPTPTVGLVPPAAGARPRTCTLSCESSARRSVYLRGRVSVRACAHALAYPQIAR
jgi:hypothetical protein